MCGIVGIVGRSASEALIRQMVDAVAHRGPSARKTVLLDGAALGTARLAVVDVAAGEQPARSGERWALLNGEVYHLPEHRARLAARGVTPAGAGDTALLGQLHEAFGDAFVEQLVGPFALALWSPAERRLFLSRDRYGMRPLYVAELPDGVAFASELSALLRHPAMPRQLDPVALRRYLTHDVVPSPRTLFAGITKLAPGESATWDAAHGLRRSAWWTPPSDPAPPHLDEAGHLHALDQALTQALRARIPDEVPWGIALSGGIDSSLLALMAARHAPPLQSFSLGWDDSPFDESPVAETVARLAAARHRTRRVTRDEVVRDVPRFLSQLDEPLGDEGYVASRFLAELAAPHATVLLTGDGGDEFFRGYPTFHAERLMRAVAHLPLRPRLGAALTWAAEHLGTSRGQLGLDELLLRFASGLATPDAVARHTTWLASVPPTLEARLFTPALRERLAHDDPFEDALRASGGAPELRVDRFYQRLFLGELLLTKVDRSLAAQGLEGRSPFLDPQVSAVAHALPDRLKLRGVTSKWALRQLARRYGLPAPIARLRKRGFSAPNAAWLRGPLHTYAQDLLSASPLLRDGWLVPATVETLFAEHTSGRVNHRKPLWALLSLAAWLEARA